MAWPFEVTETRRPDGTLESRTTSLSFGRFVLLLVGAGIFHCCGRAAIVVTF